MEKLSDFTTVMSYGRTLRAVKVPGLPAAVGTLTEAWVIFLQMAAVAGIKVGGPLRTEWEKLDKSRLVKVVIVGGGFAGLSASRMLGRLGRVQVTLVDRRNHHLFQPLLYQVALAGLSPADIATPLRTLLHNYDNVRVVMGEVEGINLESCQVNADFGTLDYDYLLLACGSRHCYFGHDEWEDCAPGLKTIEQATEIRRRILTAFELAERSVDAGLRRKLLTFIIVGGGPTGVELAGAIGEISRKVLVPDFDTIDTSHTTILLVEAGPRILPGFPVKLAERAQRDLQNLGVDVMVGSKVTNITKDGVMIGENPLVAATVIWAAGVEPEPLSRSIAVKTDRHGRIVVNDDLSVPDHPEVFVAGDQAGFATRDGTQLPGLASVALQQGKHAAGNIASDLIGKERKPFIYSDKGQLAAIGRNKAIAVLRGINVKGSWAWFIWLFVHIFYLIGFKNRFLVLSQWAFSYFTFGRSARLILSKEWHTHALLHAPNFSSPDHDDQSESQKAKESDP